MMTCRAFADVLDALLEGTLSEPERERVLAHAAHCRRCQALLRLMQEGGPAADETAVVDIVAVTSGRGCADLDESLVAYVDGRLEAADRDLIGAHVTHCAACRSFVLRLRDVDACLARTAVVDPGEDFVRDVLARTSERRGVVAWLRRWVGRPFFAMEVAYVATALIVLASGPSSPAQSVDVVERAVLAPVELWKQEREAPGGLFQDVGDLIRGAAHRKSAASAAASDVAGHVGSATKHAFRGDVDDAVWQLTMVGGDLERLWQALSGDVTALSPSTPEGVAN